LTRIESSAFASSSLQSIEIPRNVQFIDGSAFCGTRCDHVSIEAGHNRFEIRVFAGLDLPIIVPSTTLFIAYDAAQESYQITIAGINSYPERDRFQANRPVQFRPSSSIRLFIRFFRID
jgi:hypothetical protein